MNLQNIKVGMIIKNYSELCKLLGIEVKTGKSKILHMEDMKRYFDFHKEGNKIIIDEIYETPLEKIDKRLETLYGQYVEKLILDLLVQHQEKFNNTPMSLSKKTLLQNLKMINDNYKYGIINKKQLAYYLDMDTDYVKDYYNVTYNKLIYTLESAMKRMAKRSLIFWEKSLVLVVNGEHKFCNDQEIQLILDCEIEAINELNKELKETLHTDKDLIVSKQDVILRDVHTEFIKLTNTKLKKRDKNIEYYYLSYKINFTKYIKNEQARINYLLENKERGLLQFELNDLLINEYKESAKNRHNKLVSEMGIGEQRYNNKTKEIRASQKYIENNNSLITTTIPIKAKDIAVESQKKYHDLLDKNNKN